MVALDTSREIRIANLLTGSSAAATIRATTKVVSAMERRALDATLRPHHVPKLVNAR